MSDPIKLSNFRAKKVSAYQHNKKRDENALQQQLFLNMEAEGWLKVKAIGAAVNVAVNNDVIARLICLDAETANSISGYMNKYFIKHKMNWFASVSQVEFL